MKTFDNPVLGIAVVATLSRIFIVLLGAERRMATMSHWVQEKAACILLYCQSAALFTLCSV